MIKYSVKIKSDFVSTEEFENLRNCYVDKTNTGCGMTTAASNTTGNIIFEPYASTVYDKFSSFDQATRIGMFGNHKTLLIASGTTVMHINAGGYENIVCTYDAIKKLTAKTCKINLKNWHCVVDEAHDFEQVSFRPVIAILYQAIQSDVFKSVIAFTATPAKTIPACFDNLDYVKLIFNKTIKHTAHVMCYEESVNNTSNKMVVANVLRNRNKVNMIAVNNVRSISIIERTLSEAGLTVCVVASDKSLEKIGNTNVDRNNADVIIGTCKIYEGWDYYAKKDVCMHVVMDADYTGRFVNAKNAIQFFGRVRNQDKVWAKFVYTKTASGNYFNENHYNKMKDEALIAADKFDEAIRNDLGELIINNMQELREFEKMNILDYLKINDINAVKDNVSSFMLAKLSRSRVFVNQLKMAKAGKDCGNANINLYVKFNPDANVAHTTRKMVAVWNAAFVTCDWNSAYTSLKTRFAKDVLLTSAEYKAEAAKYRVMGCGCDVIERMCDVVNRKLYAGRRKQVRFNIAKADALIQEIESLKVNLF